MPELTLQEIYQEQKKETPFSHDGSFTHDFTLWVMRIAYCGATQAAAGLKLISDDEGLKAMVAAANLRETIESI